MEGVAVRGTQRSPMQLIPAGQGAAVPLARGQRIRVVNTHGTQVVDFWGFARVAPAEEYLSMEHCRELLQKIHFDVGDTLITNRYSPILTILADSTTAEHDTLIAACSRDMYRRLGRGEDHANCADNLDAALAGLRLWVPFTPSPWNLFMRAPVRDGRRIEYERPTCKPGDHVELRAEMDCVLVFSACADDVYPTNGGDGTPRDAHFQVLEA